MRTRALGRKGTRRPGTSPCFELLLRASVLDQAPPSHRSLTRRGFEGRRAAGTEHLVSRLSFPRLGNRGEALMYAVWDFRYDTAIALLQELGCTKGQCKYLVLK